MGSVVLAGLFTLIGVLVGGFFGYRMHMTLRKEKFKEVLYKEQLAAGKELTEHLAHIVIAMTQWPEKGPKPDEISSHAGSFLKSLLTVRFLLSDKLIQTGFELMEICLKVNRSDAFGEIFGEKLREFLRLIRKELAIDLITTDIITTFETAKKAVKIKNNKGGKDAD